MLPLQYGQQRVHADHEYNQHSHLHRTDYIENGKLHTVGLLAVVLTQILGSLGHFFTIKYGLDCGLDPSLNLGRSTEELDAEKLEHPMVFDLHGKVDRRGRGRG